MPPPVATFLTLAFVSFLFRRDIKEKPNVTNALWIPFAWMFINGSRFISEWMAVFGMPGAGGTLEEGSPIDRLFYIILIAAGLWVLRGRRLQVAQIVAENQWLSLFLLYCLLAVIWSDFPFVALKRWIKVLGHPVMVMIILTEPDPREAFVRVVKRCAYIIVPVSILFIKYYPQFGRGFSFWNGVGFNTGITVGKNALGVDCLILGYFFAWYYLQTKYIGARKRRKQERLLAGAFFAMICWLLWGADSKTPFGALFVGIAILLFAGWRAVDRRSIGTYIATAVILFCVAEALFGVYETIIVLLGRDATLTDRTFLWADLVKADINPLLGAGFESFWMGDRLRSMWVKFPFRPNQAHNGYLETYVNLGLIGVFLLVGLLVATYGKARRSLNRDFEWGRFRLGYLIAAIVYNWTEAGFKTVSFVFFMFYIIAIDLPRRTRPPGRASARSNDEIPRRETPMFATAAP